MVAGKSYGVSGMRKPQAAVPGGDAIARAASDASKGDSAARCMATDMVFLECPAMLDHDVGLAQLLKRTKAFLFTTYPARYSARLMLDACRRCLPRRRRLYSPVISPAFASGGRARNAFNSSGLSSGGVPPPRFRGLTCPNRLHCQTQFFAIASPTQDPRASKIYPPSPRWYASTNCYQLLSRFKRMYRRHTSVSFTFDHRHKHDQLS